MSDSKKIYNKVQTKPVGMPIPPDLQDQYLKETFGLSDEDLVALKNGTFKISDQLKREKQINQPSITKKSTQVMFFEKKPKYSKNPINTPNETFETLWKYCTSNNRLCPVPMKWNDLFGMLKNTKQNSNGGWTPSLPLILAAWYDTLPIEKQLRFKEHIQWASDNNQIDEIGRYLRSLSESDWVHFGEI